MPKLRLAILATLCLMIACSPRQFLTRRLAGTLIAGSEVFKTPQQYWLRTGVISNKDYTSPEYLVLQRHGWMTGAATPCPTTVAPPPCWDVALTPLGVDTIRSLIPNNATPSSYFSVPVARRQLVAVTGISKNENFAEVDFVWKWTPLNEVGAALSPAGPQYASTVEFKYYDDGWRLIEGNSAKTGHTLDDALKNAEIVQ